MDTQTAGDRAGSIAIHRQLYNGLLNCRFPGIVSVFGIEGLVRTVRVLAQIPLFAVVKAVFADVVATTKWTF